MAWAQPVAWAQRLPLGPISPTGDCQALDDGRVQRGLTYWAGHESRRIDAKDYIRRDFVDSKDIRGGPRVMTVPQAQHNSNNGTATYPVPVPRSLLLVFGLVN